MVRKFPTESESEVPELVLFYANFWYHDLGSEAQMPADRIADRFISPGATGEANLIQYHIMYGTM